MSVNSESNNLDYSGLNSEQLRKFQNEGFIHVSEAFSKQTGQKCANLVLDLLASSERLDPKHPTKARYGVDRRAHDTFLQLNTNKLLRTFDALAGKDRWNSDHLLTHGNFWVTFPGFHGRHWVPPYETGRWHIDLGYESRTHFALADGNCAFIPAYLLTDSPPEAAPTVALQGSHKIVSRLLIARSRPIPRFHMVAFCEGLAICTQNSKIAVPLIGAAGDAVVMHPYLVHCASANTTNHTRIMANTGIGFRADKVLEPKYPSVSAIEACIQAEFTTTNRSKSVSHAAGILLNINYAVWKIRYWLHGNLPNTIDIPPPFLRKMTERLFRSINGWISALIVRIVERR